MMEKEGNGAIIVAWAGDTDVKAMLLWRQAQGLPLPEHKFNLSQEKGTGVEKPGENGPIRTFSDSDEMKAAARVWVLVTSQFDSCADELADWVRRGTKADVQVYYTGVKNPTSYEEVYEAAEAFMHREWKPVDATRYHFNLTPGTPTTQAIMLFLSHVRYPGGTAWRTVPPDKVSPEHPERFVRISLPFNLSSGPLTTPESSTPFTASDTSLDELVRIYAPSPNVGILLLGESGVGKSRLAREIHRKCGGRDDNFEEINCAEFAATSDGTMFRSEMFGHKKDAFTGASKKHIGAFKRAKGGTIFLDEIGELPLFLQALLLRAIQERKILPVGAQEEESIGQVRIISATNRDLMEDVRAGRFRLDLFYRIATYPVRLRTLRETIAEDDAKFRAIVRELLGQEGKNTKTLTLTEGAWGILRRHHWPGNIREMQHTLGLCMIWARANALSVIDEENVERHMIITRSMAARLADVSAQTDHADGTNSSRIAPDAGTTKKTASEMCPEPPPVTSGKKANTACSDEGSAASSTRKTNAPVPDEEDIPSDLNEWLEKRRNEYIVLALRKCGGNKSKAGRMLGMTESQMTHWYRTHKKLVDKLL